MKNLGEVKALKFGIPNCRKQFGKKNRERAKDYGLDPGNEDDRIKLLNIIDDIINNAEEVVRGKWKCQDGPVLAPNNYLYIDAKGGTSVGLLNEGKMILFQPHYGLNSSDNIANLDKETWRTLLRGIIK